MPVELADTLETGFIGMSMIFAPLASSNSLAGRSGAG